MICFIQYDKLYVISIAANDIISVFLWLSNIPLDICSTYSLSIHLSVDIQVASMSWLLLQCCNEHWDECIFELWFSMDVCLGMGLLEHIICSRIHRRTVQKKVVMNWITMMVWSVTQSHTFWNAKSNGPQEAMLLIKLVDVMEFQQSYPKL